MRRGEVRLVDLEPVRGTEADQDSKAQAEQVRSVAVERVGARVGIVPPEILVSLDEALRLHLAL